MDETATTTDVVRGLSTLAALPDALREAFRRAGGVGEPASVRFVKPWAVRAATALGAPVSEESRATLEGAAPVLRDRYLYLASEHRRLGAGELPPLPAAVVGVAGAATAAVAAVVRAAWPAIVRGAVALGRLLAKRPVKVAIATTTAAALPGLYSAGRDIGRAASGAAAALGPGAGPGGGLLAGLGLPVLLLLGYLLLRK
jgi:hypothetical protein